MQYLVGLKFFQKATIFITEFFVTIRKRIDEKFFNDLMLSMHKNCIKKFEASDSETSSKKDLASSANNHPSDSSTATHKGKIKMYATCTDAEVRYPTDIHILEDYSREIDLLVQKIGSKADAAKPRTSHSEARSCFVRYTKKKHKCKKFIREKKQTIFHFLSKDFQCFFNFIDRLRTDVMACLNRKNLSNL